MRFTKLYPLIIGLLFHFSSIAQPLNGNYTIGGASPSYATLTAATAALNANGISGPVTFNIRTGIYNEKMVLTAVSGSSHTNIITFKSETNNAADVKITDEHTTDANLNYTLYIDGADNIFFRYVTLEARQNASINNPCRVVNIFNDANNIRLEDNIIKSYVTPYTDNAYGAVTCGVGGFSAGTFRDNDSLFVLRNTIIGGYCGLIAYGQGRDLTTYRSISENQFTDQTNGGIDCNGFNEGFITKNSITQTQSNISYTGIKVFDAEKTINVSSNAVSISNGITGIEFYIIVKTTGYKRIISNNAIKIDGTAGIQPISGIRTMQAQHLLLAHNTIDLNQTSTSSVSCIMVADGDTLNIQNNILLNRAAGSYSYYSTGLPKITSSNNNHFSLTSSPIASINGIVYQDLANLQTGLSIDANSFNQNPFLSGAYNIIPSGQQIFGNGIPLTDVTQDFFGTTRSATAPCIGAYEGSAPQNNAGVSYSNFTGAVFCPEQNYPLTMRITNFGQTPLTSAQIHFNGSTINWTGNLAVNQQSADISLGNWYVPRVFSQTLPSISVHLPNGQPDQTTANDTLFVTIYPRLTGNYTVGGSSPDFTNIAQASSRLTLNGICSDVFINISPGTYTEQVTFQNIAGLSPTAHLTIQSSTLDSTSVICRFNVSTSTANYVWRIRNISYLTIRNLTFSPIVNNSFKRMLLIESGKFINVKNNQFINGGATLASGTTNPTGNFLFANNYSSNQIDGSSIVTTSGDNKLTLDGSPLNPIDSVTVSENVLLGNNTRDLFINNTNHLNIFKNQISGNRSQASIDIDTCFSVNIYKNKSSVTTNQQQIDFYKCTNPSNAPGLVHTNMLLGTGGSHSGIRIQNSTNISMYFNTIKAPAKAIIYSVGNSGLICKNNILHSTSGQSVSYINSTVIPSVVSEYNNLYSTSASTVAVSSTNLTLTVFQQTYFNEYNCIYAVPAYVSSSDLHLLNSIPQDGVGIEILGMIDDIDGDLITSMPDLGADQYDLDYALYDYNIRLVKILNPDKSICNGDQTMKIRVKNVSDDIVNSFTVKWYLFNTQINQFVFTQTLNPSDSVDVPVGIYPFNGNTMYDLKFNISLPNNLTDMYNPDNTLSTQYFYPGNFVIEQRRLEECTTDVELYIPQFPRNSVLWSTGATTGSIIVNTPGTYSVTVQFDGGCSVTQSITIN